MSDLKIKVVLFDDKNDEDLAHIVLTKDDYKDMKVELLSRLIKNYIDQDKDLADFIYGLQKPQ